MSNKILIVEDNYDTRELNLFTLKQAGFEVTAAGSGGEALELLENEEFDAVVLDLAMPVLDGLTVAEEIRNNEALHHDRKNVRLAFLTAFEIDGAIKRIAAKTRVEKIFKKLEAVDLPNVLKEWLNA